MTVRMAAAPLASSDDIPNTLLENAVLRVHSVRSKKECFLMKQKILIAVISGAIWFVAGNAFWYLASPLWINVEVDEAINRVIGVNLVIHHVVQLHLVEFVVHPVVDVGKADDQ